MLAKTFGVIGINYGILAHHLVERVDGQVLKSIFNVFLALVMEMSDRLDAGDIPSKDKLDVAFMSKRILDGLENYDADA